MIIIERDFNNITIVSHGPWQFITNAVTSIKEIHWTTKTIVNSDAFEVSIMGRRPIHAVI